jgi:hypothetical protein
MMIIAIDVAQRGVETTDLAYLIIPRPSGWNTRTIGVFSAGRANWYRLSAQQISPWQVCTALQIFHVHPECWYSAKGLNFLSSRFLAILTGVRGLLHFSKQYRTVPRLYHNRFLTDPFQFFIHNSSCHRRYVLWERRVQYLIFWNLFYTVGV